MFCNKCGNILADGALFCSFCGAKNVLAQPDRQTVVTMQPNAEAPELPVIESAQIQPPAQQATMESVQASYTTEQEIPRMAPNFGGAAPAVKQKKQKIHLQ